MVPILKGGLFLCEGIQESITSISNHSTSPRAPLDMIMISYDNVKNYEKFEIFELQEISPSTLSCFVLICPTLHVHDQNACSESATSGPTKIDTAQI